MPTAKNRPIRLRRLQVGSLSLPRQVTASMRDSIRENPTKAILYNQLNDDLTSAMIRAYQLGFNEDGSRLSRARRATKRAEYSKQARLLLLKYQVDANRQLKKAYRAARDAGKTHRQATELTLRRFRTLGINAPASNRMKTTYDTATYGAYNQGVFDASQDESTVVGYRYWTQADERVRNPEHTQFHGVSLPKGDKFWRKFWPPICWNCRCFIQKLKRKPKGGWVQPPANPVPVCPGFEGTAFTLF